MSDVEQTTTANKSADVVEVTQTAEPSVPELTPVEQQAVDQGWVPLDDWKQAGKDESDWRPAKEFVDRGELYKSIHTTKRELKATQAQLTTLQRHHQYVFEKAYNTALSDLKKEKRLAIRNEDFERLEEVEDQLENLQAERAQEVTAFNQQVAATQAPVNPEFQAFVDKNSWYQSDKTLRDEADAVGYIYLNNGGTKDGLFDHVEKEMKRKFPNKFGVKRAAPNAVAAVNRTNKASPKGESMSDVPEHMRDVIRTFCESTGMKEAEYIKQLKKNGAF